LTSEPQALPSRARIADFAPPPRAAGPPFSPEDRPLLRYAQSREFSTHTLETRSMSALKDCWKSGPARSMLMYRLVGN